MSFRAFPALLLFSVPLLTSHSETVWWEAEQAGDTSMTVEGPISPKGSDSDLISGGQWLNGKVGDGLYAEYDIKVGEGGKYSLFARKFWLHGAFRWRFDAEKWITVEGLKQSIVDQVKLTSNGPASWIDLGYVNLTPGTHKFRIELITETNFEFNKIFAFDCFALSNDGFIPKGIDKNGAPKPAATPKVSQDDFGRFLPRTMALLESSTPTHRTSVNILCYGQSIIANSHIDAELRKYLAEKYPNAQITIRNTAIGGYQAPILRKTAHQDLYSQNPDLVVFHVYGGEGGELEEIFEGIRANLTAEVLTWTHHVDNYGTGIDNQRDASSEVIKTLAAKYGFELADARTFWKERLKETHQEAKDFLLDQIHLNPKGTALLKEALVPHFHDSPRATSDWKSRVRTISLTAPAPEIKYDPSFWSVSEGGLISSGTSPLQIEFSGNRIDLVGLQKGASAADLLLDGHTPSTVRDTLAVSRSSIAPGSWWPALSLVTLSDKAVPEKYTLTFHDVAPDGSSFAFDARGSVSGDEGTGKSGEDFVSQSGRLSIKAEDIALSSVPKITHKDLPPGFVVDFEIYSMSKDIWKSPSGLPAGVVPQETVIRCWKDGAHTLTITPHGDAPISLKEIMIFSPSARN